MAGSGGRKRSGTRSKSSRVRGKAGGRRFGLVGAAGFVALGAVLALAVTDRGDLGSTAGAAYQQLASFVSSPQQPGGRVARQKVGEPKKLQAERKPAAADRPVETAALPSARPPRPPKPVGGSEAAASSPAMQADDTLRTAAVPMPRPRSPVAAAPEPRGMRLTGLKFPICGEVPSKNCVVDGDTFVVGGKAFRVADIDTPEGGDPKCAREAELADKARSRLQQLLNAGPLELRAVDRDQDVYGRKLRTVHRDGRSLGETLVEEGLAHRWIGRKQSWCT